MNIIQDIEYDSESICNWFEEAIQTDILRLSVIVRDLRLLRSCPLRKSMISKLKKELKMQLDYVPESLWNSIVDQLVAAEGIDPVDASFLKL